MKEEKEGKESTEIIPVGELPFGWQKKLEFVDAAGNLFVKGKFQGITDMPPTVKQETVEVVEDKVTDSSKDDILKKIQQLQDENSYFKNRLESFMNNQQQPQKSISAEDIAKGIVAAQNETSGGQSFVEHADFDPSDILEKPCVFTSYGVFFIVADKRLTNGQVEKVPYGTVCKFEFTHAKKTTLGKEEQVSNMCTYKCQSRKIKEWLMTHPHFNIHFYLEDREKPMDVDVRKMSIVSAEYSKLMQNSNYQQILEEAKAFGVPIGGSLREIIPELAYKKGIEALRKESSDLLNRARDSYELFPK